ncbi:unnamed protein product [Chironomus riparius]|uniref:Uncharacterized protein n=1 Tax=Chironomus riparius TaxID=315576 RepID=A0A9N9RYE7_9DIPT|nr:unnamed protein product [Chironomus riparius]
MVLLSQVRNVVKRLPMIQFRAHPIHKAEPVQTIIAAQQTVKTSSAKVKAPAIEDWQLAARYRRRPIDSKEVDAINSGGAY